MDENTIEEFDEESIEKAIIDSKMEPLTQGLQLLNKLIDEDKYLRSVLVEIIDKVINNGSATNVLSRKIDEVFPEGVGEAVEFLIVFGDKIHENRLSLEAQEAFEANSIYYLSLIQRFTEDLHRNIRADSDSPKAVMGIENVKIDKKYIKINLADKTSFTVSASKDSIVLLSELLINEIQRYKLDSDLDSDTLWVNGYFDHLINKLNIFIREKV